MGPWWPCSCEPDVNAAEACVNRMSIAGRGPAVPKVSRDAGCESGVDDGLGPAGMPHAGDGGLVGHRRRAGRGAGRAGGRRGHLRPPGRQALRGGRAMHGALPRQPDVGGQPGRPRRGRQAGRRRDWTRSAGSTCSSTTPGIPKRRHVTALDIDTVTAVMHVNYLSPMRLTMDLLPQMLARGSGTIVNISSIAAKLSAPGEAAYDASKAALTAFSEAMAVDLWENGIKVMVVYPGVIDTELFTPARQRRARPAGARPSRCRWPSTPSWPGWSRAPPRSTCPSGSTASPPTRRRTSARSSRAPRPTCASRSRRRQQAETGLRQAGTAT